MVCAGALLAGYLLKAQCLAGYDGRQYQRLCYNDIQPLYGLRLFAPDATGASERVFPYEHGLSDSSLGPGGIEYPVLTGVFMWATGLLTDDSNTYLKVSAFFLAPFALLAAYLLARIRGYRSLMWAAAPALVFYAFHNWDLLVVCAAVAGFYMWWRGSPVWAAVLFGVGGAFKLYPIFFIAPLALERLYGGDKKGAIRTFAAGAGTFAAINLPFIVKSASGWWATYAFHSNRTADFNSFWHWLSPTMTVDTLNKVTFGLTAISFVALLFVSWKRAGSTGVYPLIGTCGALLAAFLLWNKVHSPQYALWILPLFVLSGLSVWWWIAYAIADALVYVGIFEWFFYWQFRNMPESGWQDVLIVGVWSRAALLAILCWAFIYLGREREPVPESATQ